MTGKHISAELTDAYRHDAHHTRYGDTTDKYSSRFNSLNEHAYIQYICATRNDE